ncbi:UDP-glucosyltransferase 2-like [Bradysia coprophila]|uniref:UDP-glucosyltransferase 2-like n=1 Tax=Bradysia coprophila TaxID=38358 RepID=UPI00187DCE34|nr:UDP-glucosyltransferase 2-like [Bradysia coprophila]
MNSESIEMNLKFVIFQCVIGLTLLQTRCSNGARILGFFGTPIRSHFIVEEPLMRELAKRGHDVTVVSTFTQHGRPLENYRYIEISDFLNGTFFHSLASAAVQSNTEKSSASTLFSIVKNLVGYSMNLLKHPKFLALKNEHFDLVIIGWLTNDYVLGLSGHFHCPSVIITPNVNFYPIRQYSGNPSSMSTIPSVLMGVNPKMAFFDRVSNFFAYIVEFFVFEFNFYWYAMPYYKEAFPPDQYPTYDEVLKNVSLVLVSQHFSGHVPEALLPNVIEIEGLHVEKEPSPLPTDIKYFLDSATDGAIFFSLGSSVNSSELPPEKISVILHKFQKMKLKILWKFETDLPKLPDNVKIAKWLPQNDILAHPNVRLFISHCGKGGITEAKFHGVPILAIPIFADQFSNAKKILNEGWAVSLPLSEINANTFSTAVDEALNNASYTHVAKKLSTLYKDRPAHPLDTAVFWVEYVIRHDGAYHMQSPAVHLNFLQYYSVDVLAFIVVASFVLVRVIRILFNVFLMKVFGIRRRHKVKKE